MLNLSCQKLRESANNMRLNQQQIEILQSAVDTLKCAADVVNAQQQSLQSIGIAVHHVNTAHLLLCCAIADYQMSITSRVVFND